ncbi:MAG: lysylphosphatidylglycerol synthase transmembrane domain-containing protein [Planctomycetota bacterium]|jgi:uncharacterized membrane protein YbhN (UPF0104 family)|nr:lysylphosphatidylglycerol synthase transmembrane domain-containing protein [Planctomycetota bacterium]MDP6762267.1 lysylphosphatidylglycerol synthase transmembrane domain-containing protein [Planctomycetota bacterium]MDP6988136.1 lysylphosphatidylglycerol synthase transmembrane domain-containing protein [Planctomycetota bacterium]
MRTPLRLALSLALAGLLLAALLIWGGVSPDELWEVWRRLSPSTYLTVLAIHSTVYLARAARFRALIPRPHRPRFRDLLGVSAAHNLASYVLPAKTGEASLVIYLRGACGVPAAEGLASLLVSRMLDVAALCGALCLACLAVGGSAGAGSGWTSLGLVLALATVVIGWLATRGERLVRACTSLARLTGLERTALGRRILGRAVTVGAALSAAGGGGGLSVAAALTGPIWLGVFGFYAILARELGMAPEIGLAEATFGSSLAVLANLLPINGFAGFGTQEAGWVVGFATLGVPRELALSSGLGVHVVQLFNVAVLGLFGHVAMALTAPGSRRD